MPSAIIALLAIKSSRGADLGRNFCRSNGGAAAIGASSAMKAAGCARLFSASSVGWPGLENVMIAPDWTRSPDPSDPSRSPPTMALFGGHRWRPPLLGSGAPCTTQLGTRIIGRFLSLAPNCDASRREAFGIFRPF